MSSFLEEVQNGAFVMFGIQPPDAGTPHPAVDDAAQLELNTQLAQALYAKFPHSVEQQQQLSDSGARAKTSSYGPMPLQHQDRSNAPWRHAVPPPPPPQQPPKAPPPQPQQPPKAPAPGTSSSSMPAPRVWDAETLLARENEIRWQDRGPDLEHADPDGTWRGQVWRAGSERWGNRGGASRHWFSVYYGAIRQGAPKHEAKRLANLSNQ